MKDIWVNDWILWDEPVSSDTILPDAHDIHPSKRGDLYSYQVEHVGKVISINADGSINMRDQNGQAYIVPSGDPHMRKVSWLRRKLTPLKHRKRSVIWKK